MDTTLDKATNILFIGGTGRCGTNLTKEILSEHRDVATLPFEYRFTVDPHGIVDCYTTLKNSWSPYIAHNKIRELEHLLVSMASQKKSDFFIDKLLHKIDPEGTSITGGAYTGWELDKWFPKYSFHVQQMLNQLKEINFNGSWPGEKKFRIRNQMHCSVYPDKSEKIFRSFLRSIFNSLLTQTKKRIFAEDNTWNLLFSEELKTILPEAKFIHVVRDPRDVVVSLTHQRWAPSDLIDAAKYYIGLMEKIIYKTEGLNTDSMLLIRLEDLVSNPNKSMNKICSFCDVAFHPTPINKDLSKSNEGRWRKELDSKSRKKLNRLLETYCSKFDYM